MIYLLCIALISTPLYLLSSDRKPAQHKIGKYTFYSSKIHVHKLLQQAETISQSYSKDETSSSNKDKCIVIKEQIENNTLKKTDISPESFNFIYDSYTGRRGNPKMLAIFCKDCHTRIMHYQKDGPGRLLRCYLDRIHAPEELHNRQYDKFNLRTSLHLKCPECRIKIGTPMIYKPENRPAYHLVQNSFYFKDAV